MSGQSTSTWRTVKTCADAGTVPSNVSNIAAATMIIRI